MSGGLSFETVTSDDGETVDLTLQSDAQIPFKVTLTADDVERLNWLLGVVRSSLKPPLSDEPPSETLIVEGEYWRWGGYPRMMNGRRVLALRHPGYGWLWFSMDEGAARDVAGYLLQPLPGGQQVEAP